jgi:hypothetical protein
LQKFLAMGVTRLERKGRKNKTVAKVRVATIKRLKTKITVESPYKEESGVIVGDVADVLASTNSKPASKAKKAAPAKEAAAD